MEILVEMRLQTEKEFGKKERAKLRRTLHRGAKLEELTATSIWIGEAGG